MLEAIRFIGRAEMSAGVNALIASKAELAGGSVVPLGNPKDSGSISSYFVGDVADDLELKIRTLPDALASSDGSPIVFVDDFIGSGWQASSILEGWLGAKQTRDLGEADREPLAPSAQEALKAKPIGFVFAGGLNDGAGVLHTRALELGLQSRGVHLGIRDQQLPTVYSALKDRPGANELIERCEQIGKALFGEEGRAEVSEERALGYGNHGLLVAFPYNVPSHTVTSLWKSGRNWMALLPRRKKT